MQLYLKSSYTSSLRPHTLVAEGLTDSALPVTTALRRLGCAIVHPDFSQYVGGSGGGGRGEADAASLARDALAALTASASRAGVQVTQEPQ